MRIPAFIFAAVACAVAGAVCSPATAQTPPAQVGQSQIGQSQIGQSQIGQSQIGQSQIGQSQIAQAQVAQAHAAQTQAAQTQTAQTQTGRRNVHPGDQFTVTMEDRQSAGSGATQTSAALTTVFALSIESEDLWRWTPVSIRITAMPKVEGANAAAAQGVVQLISGAEMSDALSAMLRLTTDIGFLCRVDRTGRCIALENWPQWRARAENMMIMTDGFARLGSAFAPPASTPAPDDHDAGATGKKQTPASPRAPGTPVQNDDTPAPPAFNWNANRSKIIHAFAAVLDGFDNRSAATMLQLGDTAAGLQGRALDVGRPERAAEEWAMPFGAQPVRLNATVTVTGLDVAGGVAHVQRQSAVDEPTMRAALRVAADFFADEASAFTGNTTGMPSGPSNPLNKLLDASDYTWSEQATADIDLTTGLARRVESHVSGTFVFATTAPARRRARSRAAPEASANTVTFEQTRIVTITPGAPATPRLERAHP